MERQFRTWCVQYEVEVPSDWDQERVLHCISNAIPNGQQRDSLTIALKEEVDAVGGQTMWILTAMGEPIALCRSEHEAQAEYEKIDAVKEYSRYLAMPLYECIPGQRPRFVRDPSGNTYL